jgi:uncharacterized protein DUF4846
MGRFGSSGFGPCYLFTRGVAEPHRPLPRLAEVHAWAPYVGFSVGTGPSLTSKSRIGTIPPVRYDLGLPLLAILFQVGIPSVPAAEPPRPSYAWKAEVDPAQGLDRRFPPPQGFERVTAEPGSFADWLRHLPLKPPGSPVLLYDGSKKPNQSAHSAVADIDTGPRDLQQCADAIIRLRAEHLWSAGKKAAIEFRFTSGDQAAFSKWAIGWRPVVRGARVNWERSAAPDDSYRSFRRYLDMVFAYAGTISLARELHPVQDPKEMRIGDVFVRPGSPGHAVLVADLAVRPATGERVFLLVQGFSPAQDIHVLVNPGDPGRSSWYPVAFGDELRTPEWTFRKDELRRF